MFTSSHDVIFSIPIHSRRTFSYSHHADANFFNLRATILTLLSSNTSLQSNTHSTKLSQLMNSSSGILHSQYSSISTLKSTSRAFGKRKGRSYFMSFKQTIDKTSDVKPRVFCSAFKRLSLLAILVERIDIIIRCVIVIILEHEFEMCKAF